MMETPPTLQKFLATYPNKTADDYYLLYGIEEEEDDIFEFARPTENVELVYVVPNKKKTPLDILSVIAVICTLVGFFLPWVDFSSFKQLKNASRDNGFSIAETYFALGIKDFSELSSLTIYLILIGAVVAVIGNILRRWDIKIIGEVFSICFIAFWIYLLTSLWLNKNITPKEVELFSYYQYGFYILTLGMILFLIAVIRNMFIVPK